MAVFLELSDARAIERCTAASAGDKGWAARIGAGDSAAGAVYAAGIAAQDERKFESGQEFAGWMAMCEKKRSSGLHISFGNIIMLRHNFTVTGGKTVWILLKTGHI